MWTTLWFLAGQFGVSKRVNIFSVLIWTILQARLVVVIFIMIIDGANIYIYFYILNLYFYAKFSL